MSKPSKSDPFKQYQNRKDVFLPVWSLCYLVYGETTGLSEKQINEIEVWKSKYPSTMKIKQPDGDSQVYYLDHPEFGNKCTALKCSIYW